MNKPQLFKVEDWTPEEAGLLDEMKSRCLNKGQYIDEKAKDKFKMLCHLEDYVLQYYEQQKEIERLNNEIKTLLKENSNKEKVIIKQNNIINELEKFIIYNLDYWNKESSQRSSLIKETLTNTLDKLKELKGKSND